MTTIAALSAYHTGWPATKGDRKLRLQLCPAQRQAPRTIRSDCRPRPVRCPIQSRRLSGWPRRIEWLYFLHGFRDGGPALTENWDGARVHDFISLRGREMKSNGGERRRGGLARYRRHHGVQGPAMGSPGTKQQGGPPILRLRLHAGYRDALRRLVFRDARSKVVTNVDGKKLGVGYRFRPFPLGSASPQAAQRTVRGPKTEPPANPAG